VSLGWNEGLRGNWGACFETLGRATALFEEHRDHHWASAGHRALGYMLAQCERYHRAVRHLEEAMKWARRGGDRTELAGSYQHLGEIARYRGQLDQAVEFYEKAERLFDGVSTIEWTAARLNRALAEMERGDFDAAEDVLVPLAAMFAKFDDSTSLGSYGRLCRGVLRARRGDWSQWPAIESVLSDIERKQWRERDLAWMIEKLGDLAEASGGCDRARRCWEVAAAQWTAIGRQREADLTRQKLSGLP
jgi:hypothetical protein